MLVSWYFHVSVGLEMLQKDKTSSNGAFEGGLMPGIDGKVRYEGGMAESVGGLAFSCIYLYGWKTSQKHEASSNELAS